MAFIFGKNKQKKEVNPVPNSAEKTVDIVDTVETQNTIASNRKVRQEIEQRFRELKDPENRRTMQRSAEKNQEMLDAHARAHEYNDSENGNYRDFAELEKSLYIVTGGYREEPSETNNVPRANLDYYTKAITILEAKFKNTSSANAVETGADQLDVFVADFLGNLRNALEMGYAMKANAAIDLIRYVFVVGHRYEDYSTEEERMNGIRKRVDFLDKVGKGLIGTVDYLYEQVKKYKNTEEKYSKSLAAFVEKREEYDRDCPSDVKQLIENLGFKNAMAQLPPGDERRTYLDLLLHLRTKLTNMLIESMELETYIREIIGIKNDIETEVFEVRQAFDASGKEFDFHKHMKLLGEIHEKNFQKIREANDRAVARANAEVELMGKLKAIADNPELGESVQAAAFAVRNYDFVERQNQELTKNIERRRAEFQLEKKNEEVEREKRRIQEQKQYLEEIKAMEEELQEIRNNADALTEPSMAEETADNRTIIMEDN